MSEEVYPRIYYYRRLVQAKLFIDTHFAEPIDLNNISGASCFSKFHFIRQFKMIYQKTPYQYLTEVRIRNAKELLNKGIPVSDVCYAVGFESLGSFSNLFKRIAGTTPSDYLRQQQDKKRRMQESPLSFVPACFAGNSGWN